MLSLFALLAYLAFAFVTAALMWAIREAAEEAGKTREWEPGTNPHSWRF